jgi:hypothetical protein
MHLSMLFAAFCGAACLPARISRAMTQKQWYIAGAVILVLVIVVVAYFALRKHGDANSASGTLPPGFGLPWPTYCINPDNGQHMPCPAGQICPHDKCIPMHYYPAGTACAADYDCASGLCALAADGASMVCCSGGSTVTHNGRNYCQ